MIYIIYIIVKNFPSLLKWSLQNNDALFRWRDATLWRSSRPCFVSCHTSSSWTWKAWQLRAGGNLFWCWPAKRWGFWPAKRWTIFGKMRTSPSLLNMCIKSCQLEDLTDLTTKMMKKKPHGCLRIFALEGESVVASSGSPLRGMILASNEATARACKWLGRHSGTACPTVRGIHHRWVDFPSQFSEREN